MNLEELLADNSATITVDDADELLASLEAETTVEAESPVIEDDFDIGINVQELYEAQGDGKLSVGSDEDAAPINEAISTDHSEPARTPRRGRRVNASTAADGSEPGVIKTRSQMLKQKADVSGLEQIGYDAEEIDFIMTAIDGAPKKVGEKASNLLRYALGREHLSNTTRFTLNTMNLPHPMTSLKVTDLVKHMQDKAGFSIGTARSQAQQMSRLFGILGMGQTIAGVITLDYDNELTIAAYKRLAGDPFVPVSKDADETAEEQEPGGVEAEAPVEPVTNEKKRRAAKKAGAAPKAKKAA